MAQPDLDYMAPEIQLNSGTAQATAACDIYSFGQLICALHNDGKALIQAGHNVSNYGRQLEQVTSSDNALEALMIYGSMPCSMPSNLTFVYSVTLMYKDIFSS